ncbi:MAG: hypothetical protein L6Q71_02730, partial [Planctomycetes bacterium]|nr:hypothetical protein [Planctomycetota bacterium]
EEEIASSVLAARVYAMNNAAPAYMLQAGRPADLMVYLPEQNPSGSAGLLVDKGDYAGNAAGGPLTSLMYARPTRDRTYSFGAEAGGTHGHLLTRQYLPMAIAIELTFVNDQFDIDGTDYYGTVRTISRVISVPN